MISEQMQDKDADAARQCDGSTTPGVALQDLLPDDATV
jgi:hypothetical protein